MGGANNGSIALKQYLNQKNFRFTWQRLAVLEAIDGKENKHLIAPEIYEIVKGVNPKIGIATVYKNLRMLEREGILSKFELPDKPAHYEINDSQSVHCHLICAKCGKIIEIKGNNAQNVVELFRTDNHFTFHQCSINFYGLCENCSDPKEPALVVGNCKESGENHR